MSDQALERLAGVIFATIYPFARRPGAVNVAESVALESARIAVSIRAHLNALTRRPDAEPVVPPKF